MTAAARAATRQTPTTRSTPSRWSTCSTASGSSWATPPASRKARTIAARPQVTVTVEDRTDPGWVSAQGRAELIDGPTSRELNDRVYRTWMTEEGVDVVGSMMADVTIAVTPHRWSSWGIEPGLYTHLRDAGIPLYRPKRWFR